MACGSGLTRGKVALTHRTIEALRPAEAPYRVSDQRCIGLGRAAIFMLSDALKLYLIEWNKQFGLDCHDEFKMKFKKGYWNGYRACFEKHIGVDWTESPASLAILEQVAMARNSSQHAQSLSMLDARHRKNIRSQFPNPLFVHDHARYASGRQQIALLEHWFGPELVISEETFFKAIDEAEHFVSWLEPKLQKASWDD